MTVVQDHTGYIPTSCLEGYRLQKWPRQSRKRTQKQDPLPRASGEGVFADAVDGVTSTGGSGSTAAGVQIGTPVSVSFGRNTENTGNIPDHALLSVQHLLRTMGEWNYFHRSNSYYHPYDRSRSEPDPIRFQSSDQWPGLCC